MRYFNVVLFLGKGMGWFGIVWRLSGSVCYLDIRFRWYVWNDRIWEYFTLFSRLWTQDLLRSGVLWRQVVQSVCFSSVDRVLLERKDDVLGYWSWILVPDTGAFLSKSSWIRSLIVVGWNWMEWDGIGRDVKFISYEMSWISDLWLITIMRY